MDIVNGVTVPFPNVHKRILYLLKDEASAIFVVAGNVFPMTGVNTQPLVAIWVQVVSDNLEIQLKGRRNN